MIRHVVAIDRQRGIAKDGVQPWKLPTDEQYFAELTKQYGGVVLMGRKTFEVIGKALPDRQNFVLTRDSGYQAEGVTVVHDAETLLVKYPDIWVIGGRQVFAATLDRADELYITEIDADYRCDTFYPEYLQQFEPARTGDWQMENGTRFRFMVYKPKTHML